MEYKYNSLKDLVLEFFVDFPSYFKPFFESYNKNKRNFFIQVSNLVLLFFILYFISDGLLEKITGNMRGGNVLNAKIVLLIFSTLIISFFKENKSIKWQMLFQTGYTLTKQISAIGCIYIQNNKKYE